MQPISHHRKRELKIVVLGDRGTGKTTFVSQTILGTKSQHYIPTSITHNLSKEVFVDVNGWRSPITLTMWDTPGSRRHSEHTCPLTQSKVLGDIDAIVIIFDVTQGRSFFSLDWWFKRIAPLCADKLVKQEPLPIVLVGSKLDLLVDDSSPQREPKLKKSRSVELSSSPFQHPNMSRSSETSDSGEEKSALPFDHLFPLSSLNLPPSPGSTPPPPLASLSPSTPERKRATMKDFNMLRRKVIRWCNDRPHFSLFHKYANLHETEDVSDVLDLIQEQFIDEITPQSEYNPHIPASAFVNVSANRQVHRLDDGEMDEFEVELWSEAGESVSEYLIDEELTLPEAMQRARSVSATIDTSSLMNPANRSVEADFTVRAPLWLQKLVQE